MKFLLRCLLVLAIAVVFGVVLYYAVQALPTVPSNPPSGAALQPEGVRNAPDPGSPRRARPEGVRPEVNRGGGFRWRSLLQIARRFLLFSVLVFVAYLGKKFVFDRKTNKKDTAD